VKKLIIVHHGYYNPDGHLSLFGREQIRALASHIKPLIASGSVVVLSSPKTQAAESADILARRLNATDSREDPALFPEDESQQRMSQALDLIQRHENAADYLFVVTHRLFVRGLPFHFSMRKGWSPITPHALDKGGAIVIDCEKQGGVYIRPF
jgi:broad specificity phosphatase PhoE